MRSITSDGTRRRCGRCSAPNVSRLSSETLYVWSTRFSGRRGTAARLLVAGGGRLLPERKLVTPEERRCYSPLLTRWRQMHRSIMFRIESPEPVHHKCSEAPLRLYPTRVIYV